MFKIISGIILFISLLTGCSKSGSYHDASYYESHLAQASEVVKTCKAMNADFVKTLKKDKNCRNAYFVEFNAAFISKESINKIN